MEPGTLLEITPLGVGKYYVSFDILVRRHYCSDTNVLRRRPIELVGDP